MKKITLFLLFLMMSIMISMVFSGCISMMASNPEASLEKRVNELMTAKVHGNWIKVYTFFDENYRSKIPRTRFETHRKLQIMEYRIENIQIDKSNTKARVLVIYDMFIHGYRVEGAKNDQIWVIENNNWFLAAKPITGIIAD